MKLGTFHPVSQCAGKEAFDDPQIARKAARRKPGREHYRCSYCGRWHVGNSNYVRQSNRAHRPRGVEA